MNSRMKHWRDRIVSWEWFLAALAIVTIIAASAATPGFADPYNLESSVARMATKALLVLPLVFLIIAREIDISIASIAGLGGIVFGMLYQSGLPTAAAAIGAVLVGCACGALNGVLVSVLGLPSLVVTLGSLALFRGLCYVLVGGQPISDVPPELVTFAYGLIPGTVIPTAIVPFIVLAALATVLLHSTPYGRRVFAIGGNPDTATYAGVRRRRMTLQLFIASGAIGAFAGILQIGATSSASPDGLLGYELDAITVVFLGGVSFLGGKGRMAGVLWALVIVTVVRSMLQLQNVGSFGQAAVIGLILIGSLLVADVVTRIASARATRRARATRLAQISEDASTPTAAP